MVEHTSVKYPPRTKVNVQQSDGTVLFGDFTKGGTKLTLSICIQESRPYLANPTAEELHQWLEQRQIAVLNVAGSRGSQLSVERLSAYRQILFDALVCLREHLTECTEFSCSRNRYPVALFTTKQRHDSETIATW